MKKIIVLSVLGLISFSSVLFADKTGVGSERGQDRTGSPVGSVQQCGQCHSGGNFSTTITTRLKDSDGNIVTEYNGGEVYTYEVEIGGTGAKHGFQTVALKSNNANAGTLSAISSNAKVITMNSRIYAEHTAASVSNLFVMQWIAPTPGSGTIKFYAAGNNVNANNASSGDQVAFVSGGLSITESATSAVNENLLQNEIEIYPNPAISNISIRIPDNKKVNVEIYDATGKQKLIKYEVIDLINLDVSELEPGIYVLLVSGDINTTEKFILQ